MIINTTYSDVTLKIDGKPKVFKGAGKHCAYILRETNPSYKTNHGIPVNAVTEEIVCNLPDPEIGTIYLTTEQICKLLPDRTDLVFYCCMSFTTLGSMWDEVHKGGYSTLLTYTSEESKCI